MTRHAARRHAAVLALLSLAIACGDSGAPEDAPAHAAEPIADQEDAVCGMLVREQSAPRAQAVHRDGARVFFCSLGDLLVHLDAPSPHGRAVAVFVEVMRAEEDPMASHTGEHPWRPADTASYVLGVPRTGIMGAPVLAYADPGSAERVAARYPDSRVVDFDGLRQWWAQRQSGRRP